MLIFAFILFLAACSNGENVSTEPNESNHENEPTNEGDDPAENENNASDGEQITLRMTWWGSQSRHDQTMEIIELFEKQNPDIKINAEFTGWDGYFEKMAAAAAGNNLPDIMQQNFGEYLNQYADKGLLADLTPFIEDGLINVDGVSETVLESGKKGEEILGLPTGTNALTTIYNKTMLDELGIEAPNADWTWDEHQEIAREIHEATGEFGTRHFEPKNIFEYYLREQGYTLFNEDGTDLGYEDDQLLTDYFEMGKTLVDENVAPGYDTLQQIKGIEDELIVHGKSPFDFRWSNQLGALVGATQDQELELTLLPGENYDQGMYLKPAMLWSISEDSKH